MPTEKLQTKYREPLSLHEVVKKVITELTSRQAWGNRRYCYAPHLVSLGQELDETFSKVTGLPKVEEK